MLHTIFRQNLPIPGKKILKDLNHIRNGGHLGHVTGIILINFHFHVPKSLGSIQNLVKICPVVSERASFNFVLIIQNSYVWPALSFDCFHCS